jgi:hypothetical protein
MEMEERKEIKIALLNEEMDAIHYANDLFWKQGTSQSKTAKSEYQFRNERLDKIRAELAQLRGAVLDAPHGTP